MAPAAINSWVLSVDEKPSIQAIERASGYVETDSGKVVRARKSTYKRHGTLNLLAALEVGTGQVPTKFTESKRREREPNRLSHRALPAKAPRVQCLQRMCQFFMPRVSRS
jgi:hypothetical protein